MNPTHTKLSLLSVRPAVTFPSSERHRPLSVMYQFMFVGEPRQVCEVVNGLTAERPENNPPPAAEALDC